MNAARALILGAGGLGAAIARDLAARGLRVHLAARRPDSLAALAAELNAPLYTADITDPESLSALQTAVGPVDWVINAAGYDVRKSLDAHTRDDIERLMAVNLTGAIHLTRTFLPALLARPAGTPLGMIAHLGGFADGRLSLPYYSVDAATRAGLRGFVDAVNRELTPRARARLLFFCPAPADTEAERPFHGLWRALGTPIVPPSAVAQALYAALTHGRKVAVMGTATRLFAALNAAFPGTADRLLLDRYREKLAEFFAHSYPTG